MQPVAYQRSKEPAHQTGVPNTPVSVRAADLPRYLKEWQKYRVELLPSISDTSPLARVHKLDTATVYTIDYIERCNCYAGVQFGRECKHVAMYRTILQLFCCPFHPNPGDIRELYRIADLGEGAEMLICSRCARSGGQRGWPGRILTTEQAQVAHVLIGTERGIG